MKTRWTLLALIAIAILTPAARAQLVVPSYERLQPFIFCGSVPQGAELSVPFDLINRGTSEITLDSATASGDTADFYSNFLIGSGQRYLNPLMWRYISQRIIEPGGVFFNSFFFTPRTPGAKQLLITVYYHDASGARTTQATVRFNTASGLAGLGFLRLANDTITYHDSIGYSSVTYDRTLQYSALQIEDTLAYGDTLYAPLVGEERVDLTTCGDVALIAADVSLDTQGDSFAIKLPSLPFVMASGSSIPLDYMYISRQVEIPVRTATVVFRTAEGPTQTFRLRLVTPAPSAVDDEPEDEAPQVVAGEAGSVTGAPNPFSGFTTLRVSTGRAAHARLAVVDQIGREVAVLVDGVLEPGLRELPFDASQLAAGTYFVRLTLDGQSRAYRLVHVR